MKINRAYENTDEFKSRQGWLDFDAVVIACLEITASVKKTLGSWAKSFLKALKPKAEAQAKRQIEIQFPTVIYRHA